MLKNILQILLASSIITGCSNMVTSKNVKEDVVKLNQEFDQMFKKLGQPKDPIIFIGARGVGKTTILEKIRGKKLVKRFNDDGTEVIEVEEAQDNDNNSGIGHGIIGKTVYPESYFTDDGLCFIDPAGSLENIDKYKKLIGVLALNGAIRTQLSQGNNKIKIAMVASLSSLKSARGKRFMDSIINNLKMMFNENELQSNISDPFDSMLFLFTKSKINSERIKNHLEKNEKSLSQTSPDEFKEEINIYKKIISKNNIVTFDPLSDQSVINLKQSLLMIRPIDSKRINFLGNESDLIFLKTIAEEVHGETPACLEKVLRTFPQEIKSLNMEIEKNKLLLQTKQDEKEQINSAYLSETVQIKNRYAADIERNNKEQNICLQNITKDYNRDVQANNSKKEQELRDLKVRVDKEIENCSSNIRKKYDLQKAETDKTYETELRKLKCEINSVPKEKHKMLKEIYNLKHCHNPYLYYDINTDVGIVGFRRVLEEYKNRRKTEYDKPHWKIGIKGGGYRYARVDHYPADLKKFLRVTRIRRFDVFSVIKLPVHPLDPEHCKEHILHYQNAVSSMEKEWREIKERAIALHKANQTKIQTLNKELVQFNEQQKRTNNIKLSSLERKHKNQINEINGLWSVENRNKNNELKIKRPNETAKTNSKYQLIHQKLNIEYKQNVNQKTLYYNNEKNNLTIANNSELQNKKNQNEQLMQNTDQQIQEKKQAIRSSCQRLLDIYEEQEELEKTISENQKFTSFLKKIESFVNLNLQEYLINYDEWMNNSLNIKQNREVEVEEINRVMNNYC